MGKFNFTLYWLTDRCQVPKWAPELDEMVAQSVMGK
jgi:hypothetical protein